MHCIDCTGAVGILYVLSDLQRAARRRLHRRAADIFLQMRDMCSWHVHMFQRFSRVHRRCGHLDLLLQLGHRGLQPGAVPDVERGRAAVPSCCILCILFRCFRCFRGILLCFVLLRQSLILDMPAQVESGSDTS